MSHQHQHSDLMKTILGNMSEYQLPPTEKVASLWFSDKEHAFLSGKKKVPIPVGTSWEEPDDDEERIVKAVFHPNHKNFDLLHKITFENFFPEVKVKDEYESTVEIAWPKHAYLQTIKLLELVFDNEQSITTLMPESLLILLQSVPNSCTPYHDQNLGNCPALNSWTTHLPSTKILYTVPFPFSKHPCLALPLFLHKDKPISFHGVFRTQLDRILRMRRIDDGGNWVEIPFDAKYVETKGFTIPRVFGTYIKLLKDEKDEIMTQLKNTECIREYDDFSVVQSTLNEIEIEEESPVKTIFWYAQKKEKKETNDFANFLDGSEGEKSGNEKNDEIVRSGHMYLSKAPQALFSVDRMELNEYIQAHMKGLTVLPGIWFHSFGVGDLFSLNSPMTVQFTGLYSKLKIQTEDDDERRKRDEPDLVFTAVLHTVKRIYYSVDNEGVSVVVQDTGGSSIKEIQQDMRGILE